MKMPAIATPWINASMSLLSLAFMIAPGKATSRYGVTNAEIVFHSPINCIPAAALIRGKAAKIASWGSLPLGEAMPLRFVI
jgi:hypothetical protein